MPYASPDELQEELIRVAMTFAARRHVARLIYICDQPLPPKLIRPGVKRKLIHVVSSAEQRDRLEESKISALLVPSYPMGRQEKFKLALMGGVARGLLREGDTVVGLVGWKPRLYPDTLLINRISPEISEGAVPVGELSTGRIAPSVFDAIVELAVELGMEGWEGHSLGTLFAVGDSARVMESSRQLALNPFQGYSESERNLEDPAVRDALRNFATLEGGFVVREDGIVLAAGRYLQFEPSSDVEVPLGLGARHMAAALCSRATDAIVVVVSQSTGKVRVFRKGRIVLELTPSHRRT